MPDVSSTSACRPKAVVAKAAAPFALRSPPSFTLDDQAESPPDSKPSLKIRSSGPKRRAKMPWPLPSWPKLSQATTKFPVASIPTAETCCVAVV